MKKGTILKQLGTMLVMGSMVLGMMTTVVAAPENVPDPDQKVKLTVHKYKTTTNPSNAGTGLEITDDDELNKMGTPAPDVEFKLTKLIEEVKSPDGTVLTPGLNENTTVEIVTEAMKSTTVYYGKTGEDGMIDTWYLGSLTGTAFTELDHGFYLLEETQGLPGYDMAKTTIVTLPFGYVTGSASNPTTEYNYDVHVYPKNVENTPIKKEVVDKDNVYKPGDLVEWKITGKVFDTLRKYDEENEEYVYGSYKIYDTLDGRLDYDSAYNTGDYTNGYKVEIDKAGSTDEILLTNGVDYTFSKTDQKLSWELTEAGIDKVMDNNSNQLYIYIRTIVNEKAFVGADDDVIENGAVMEFKPEGHPEGEEPIIHEIPDPEKPYVVVTKVKIIKTDGKSGDFLPNAKFMIATTEAKAKAGTFLEDEDGNKLEVTTNSSGIAYFSGMNYSDAEEVVKDANGKITAVNFYLWETQAPAGYERSQNVWKVTCAVTEEVHTIEEEEITYYHFSGEAHIKNYKPGDPEGDKHFNLPLTGGVGTILFTIGGIMLISATAGLYLRLKKKEQ